jgi:hypothetical protein
MTNDVKPREVCHGLPLKSTYRIVRLNLTERSVVANP